jgi:hypothetical protein
MGGAPIRFLRDEMNTRGYSEIDTRTITSDQLITVVFTSLMSNERFDPASYAVQCIVKNVTDDDTYKLIENKKSLHELIEREDPRAYDTYFSRTTVLDSFTYPSTSTKENAQVFILRPSGVGFYSGKGIVRVTNARELKRAKREYMRKHIPLCNVIVSEYLDEPYLWNSRKFHLRLYMMIRADPEFRARDSWELWRDDDWTRPRGKILTAAKEYEHAHYDDAAIHDSHADTTPKALFFPTHAGELRAPWSPDRPIDLREIYAQIDEICSILAHQLERVKVRPYSESKCAFDVFGLDLMIVRKGARDPSVILIEVNDRVGYAAQQDPLMDEFFRDYFQWLFDRGIAPLLASQCEH